MSDTYSLKCSKTYESELSASSKDINNKYIQVVIEYFQSIIKQKITMVNHNQFQFIYLRGLDTITHVFNYMLISTRNLEASYYHSIKAVYLYIEFISQISDNKNSFLQLTSKEAVLYVYKKTIFLLDKSLEHKKEESELISYTQLQIDVYKKVAMDIIVDVPLNELYITHDNVTTLKKNMTNIQNMKLTKNEWNNYFTYLP